MSKEELKQVLVSAGFEVTHSDDLEGVEDGAAFLEVEGRILAAHLDPDTLKLTAWWNRCGTHAHEATADELRQMVGEAQVLLSTQEP